VKLTSVLASFALVGLVTVADAPLKIIDPQLGQAFAQEMQMKGPTSIPIQKKIESIAAHKGQLGGGDELRRYFFGDLLPVAVQPGGAGMVKVYPSVQTIFVKFEDRTLQVLIPSSFVYWPTI